MIKVLLIIILVLIIFCLGILFTLLVKKDECPKLFLMQKIADAYMDGIISIDDFVFVRKLFQNQLKEKEMEEEKQEEFANTLDRLEIRKAKNNEWYWVAISKGNHEETGSSLPETYKNKLDCLNNARRFGLGMEKEYGE